MIWGRGGRAGPSLGLEQGSPAKHQEKHRKGHSTLLESSEGRRYPRRWESKARATPAKVPRNTHGRIPLRVRGIFLGTPFRGETEN